MDVTLPLSLLMGELFFAVIGACTVVYGLGRLVEGMLKWMYRG